MVLFSHKYGLSLSFFFVLILWILVWFHSSKIIETTTQVKGIFAVILGAIVAVIFAQIQIFNLFAKTVFDILFKIETFWLRIAITAAFFLFVPILIFITFSTITKKLKKIEKEKEEKTLKQEVEKVKAFTKEIE